MAIRGQALAGHRDVAFAAANELLAEATKGTVRLRQRDRAYMELALGRTDAALRSFRAALDERDPSLLWITVDPRTDGVRKDPRFQEIVRKLNIG
jgi:hypothetical protein